MLRSIASQTLRHSTRATTTATATANIAKRSMVTIGESPSASDAWKKSCYFEIDYAINEDAMMYEAVQKFSAYDIGCLVTTNAAGEITGVVSERDYINKVALLGKSSKDTPIREVSTKSAKLETAQLTDTVDVCMNKMLTKDIRHLPMLDDDGKVIGMLSVKDLVKEMVAEKEKTIQMLSDFALGKGGHFGGE